MKKIIFLMSIFFLIFVTFASAQNQVTLVTYYPAPFGMYEEMRVMGYLGVGTTYPGTVAPASKAKVFILDTNTSLSTDGLLVAGSTGTYATNHSVALGNGVRATGLYSVAMGWGTDAQQQGSTAMGSITTANGYHSIATGYGTTASGFGSMSMGQLTKAVGLGSVSMGNNTQADPYASLVIGQFNVSGGNSNSWVAGDPVFIIGNGASAGSLSNAVTVLKNGRTGIGTTAPDERLHVVATFADKGAGIVVENNGGGTAQPDIWLRAKDITTPSSITFGHVNNQGLLQLTGTTPPTFYMTRALGVGVPDALGILHLQPSADNNLLVRGPLWSNSNTGSLTTGVSIYSVNTTNTLTRGMEFDANPFLFKSGNVGIGTANPQERLDVNGKIRFSGQHFVFNSANAVVNWGSAGSGNLYFRTLNTMGEEMAAYNDRMTILNNGNIGIGITNPGAYKLYINGSGFLNAAAWAYSSDKRLKENIVYIDSGLNIIRQLKPARFDFIKGEKKQVGFIAQDVREVLPDVVKEGTDGMLGMKTESLIPYLVKAMQEQQKEIDGLKKMIKDLELKASDKK